MGESGEMRGEAGGGEQQLGLLQRGHVVLQRQGGVGLAGPHCTSQGLYLQSPVQFYSTHYQCSPLGRRSTSGQVTGLPM